jgi:lipopolysaccharide/colanic/teichoic acid biosynthesis glycosyltransferase
MSIVGNRPLPVYEAELITAGDLSKGFSASGITGLWQVELRGKGGKCLKTKECVLTTNMPTNLQEIIIHFGMIKLILRTIPALLQKGPFKNIDYHKIT